MSRTRAQSGVASFPPMCKATTATTCGGRGRSSAYGKATVQCDRRYSVSALLLNNAAMLEAMPGEAAHLEQGMRIGGQFAPREYEQRIISGNVGRWLDQYKALL